MTRDGREILSTVHSHARLSGCVLAAEAAVQGGVARPFADVRLRSGRNLLRFLLFLVPTLERLAPSCVSHNTTPFVAIFLYHDYTLLVKQKSPEYNQAQAVDNQNLTPNQRSGIITLRYNLNFICGSQVKFLHCAATVIFRSYRD